MAFSDEQDARDLEQMTDEEFWQFARLEAAKVSPGVPDSDSSGASQYLECELQRGKCYAPLYAIESVIPASSSLARLPFAPRWLPGVMAWRGEIVAVVNLDEYLSGLETPFSGGMLLVARHPQCVIGLRVPGVGLTTSIEFEQLAPAAQEPAAEESGREPTVYTVERAGVITGLYTGCPVRNVEALVRDVTLQIGMAV